MNDSIAKYINIALGIAVIVAFALFVRGVVTSRYTVLQPIQSALPAASTGLGVQGGARFAEYAPIVEGTLFAPAGVLDLLGTTAAVGKGDVPRSNTLQSISLVGTVVGASKDEGYGLFKELKSNKQDIFKVGDRVFNVGRLKYVDRMTVTIVQSGKSYKLHMPEVSKMEGGSAPGSRFARSRGPFGSSMGSGGSGFPIGGAGDRALARRVGEREWAIDKRALAEALSDTGNMLTQARILPYRVNGKTQGFRLSSVQRSGVFALIGLRSGDILLKVNDFAIDSPEKGIQLLSGLGGETNISLDILRGGKPTKLNYEIR